MDKVYASIITIGDELLIGQVIDTNSAFIAQELNKIGVWMKHRMAVGDDWDDIWEALEESAKVSDIILITGGLGPTADDITKPLLNKYFGGKMIVHQQTLEHIKEIFFSTGRPLIESNYKQAEIPDTCSVLFNKLGTAPGMLFEKNGKLFVSMPGVPFEMQYIMNTHVLPYIKARFTLPAIAHKTLTTLNIGESFLAERLKEYESQLPSHVKLAYLPNVKSVRLRLTVNGSDEQTVENDLNFYFNKLYNTIEDVVVIRDDKTMSEEVMELLKQSKKSISTAESCTGGYIAASFTEAEGSSSFFKGGVVAYCNEAKNEVLDVETEVIEKVGVVSEEAVKQMAQNVRKLLKTDYSIATSGILGPASVENKPVGTVWIAVANERTVQAEKFQFNYNRKRNNEAAIKFGLNMLRKLIVEDQLLSEKN